MDLLSIIGLIVGIGALIQAAWYNHSANKLNKRTEQLQKYVENTITHSNLINMYTFLSVRDMAEYINAASPNGKVAISLTKDTVIFNKSLDYSQNNSNKCKQIIFESGVIKPKVYGDKVTEFLNNDEQTLKITLKYELSKESIEQFISMSAKLLEYDICVLHNIHF